MTNLSDTRGPGPLDGDTLMAQLTDLDPIKDQLPAIDVAGILRRIERERRPVTMRSLRLRVAAALVGTASLVGVGIVALTASANLPSISVASPSGLSVINASQPGALSAPLAVGVGIPETPGIQYNEPMIFSASSSLATPTSGPAFAISVPDRASEAASLAGVFGITTSPSDAGGSILYRSATNSEMFYSPASGLPYFLYLGDADGPDYGTIAGNSQPASSIGATNLETADQQNAMNLYESLGLTYQLDSPVFTQGDVTSSTTGVQTIFVTISYSVLVGGFRTDQVVEFTYSGTGALLEAEAPVFSVATSYTYPLISGVDAATAMTNAEAARESNQTTTSVPLRGTPTVSLNLDHAVMGLMTYRDTNGNYWMLPTFWFTTSVTLPDGSIAHGVYAWLAVSRQYVSQGVAPESIP
jgi:hypothetical protein